MKKIYILIDNCFLYGDTVWKCKRGFKDYEYIVRPRSRDVK